MDLSLRTTLFGLVAIPLLAIAVGVGVDTYQQGESDVESAYRTAASIAEISAAQAEQFVGKTKFALEELSKRPLVRELNASKCDPLLAEWHRLQPAYANILTLDAMGHLVCSATRIRSGAPAGPDPKYYFSEVARTRKFTIGKPAKGFVSGRWVSTLAYPILDADGNLIGVVAASVDLATYNPLVSFENVPTGTVAGILNGEGYLIARSEDAEKRVGSISDAEATKMILEKRNGRLRARGHGGAERFIAFTPIRGSDWIAYTSIETAAILGPLRQEAMRRLAYLVCILLFVAVLTLWLSRRFARPIENISTCISEITKGDRDRRVVAEGPRELKYIATALNDMLEAMSEADAALNKINAELEMRVAERTAELETANQELESFSGAVSHDLRAPLRVVSNYVGLIEEDCKETLNDNGLSYLEKIRRNVNRMAKLIEALHALSSVAQKQIQPSPVNLSEMANEIIEELQFADSTRRVEWAVTPGLTAVGDPSLLRIVLQNLIGNAWKYSSKRDVARIEFGITKQDEKDAYFVHDNGVGFDMKYVNKLFVALQRLHLSNEFEGTGIGLATIKRIITRHNGKVWAEAKLDQGATFYFSLPA